MIMKCENLLRLIIVVICIYLKGDKILSEVSK